ncbi:MAG: hypothetical protein GEV05_12065 [Betaproteobacteria bacterium]|nr:hypothetical protein [Betaproteobacteria bacterium]
MSTSELLVYGLVIAGFLLVNYVMQLAANKARRQQQERQATGAPPQPQAEEMLDYSWGGAPVAQPVAYELPRAPVPVYTAPPAQSVEPAARIHPAALGLLHDGRQTRNAIVLMTVLGPCRAIEPYAPREP